ncbi:MAG: hypothetical protein RMM06_09670 [Armatimonadota bacterium]|nr:hypothetical protein [Armatimonadota bacterium]
MWLTLLVVALSVLFLWREWRALRQGASSRRQFTIRLVGCILLVLLALVLQFRDLLLAPARAAEGEVRLLRLLQFSAGVLVLVVALVLVALLDARETLQRYLRERRQAIDELLWQQNAPPSSSDGQRDEGTV